ncbi:MAG: hypothetical protein H6621_08435 [Halobacteriovoraceae bacterium]|nr:hypothetical protein [Halobacteriovoraceae bacterium]
MPDHQLAYRSWYSTIKNLQNYLEEVPHIECCKNRFVALGYQDSTDHESLRWKAGLQFVGILGVETLEQAPAGTRELTMSLCEEEAVLLDNTTEVDLQKFFRQNMSENKVALVEFAYSLDIDTNSVEDKRRVFFFNRDNFKLVT